MRSYLMACYKFAADLNEAALVDEVEIGLSGTHFKTLQIETLSLSKSDLDNKEVKEFKFNVPGGTLVIYNKDLK